jgi:hypothetical protein
LLLKVAVASLFMIRLGHVLLILVIPVRYHPVSKVCVCKLLQYYTVLPVQIVSYQRRLVFATHTLIA